MSVQGKETIRAGSYEIRSVVAGWDRLDGGAMFGVVPKVLWEKNEDVDDRNRILMALRVLLAVDRDAGRVILVDAGAGPKWSEKEAARFAMEHDAAALGAALDSFGLTSADVTDVVLSHLHFDHAGGITGWGEEEGETKLLFPNARHWVHEKHLAHALSPTDRDRASFLERDFRILSNSDRLSPVTGDDPRPDIPGVSWNLSHGHTPYQLLPIFEDAKEPVLFAGDLLPTSSHLPPPWVMSYDLFPLTSLDERKKFYDRARADHTIVAFSHDRSMGAARLDFSGKRPAVGEKLLVTPR